MAIPRTLKELAEKNDQLFRDNKEKFLDIFSTELGDYWHDEVGFDLIRFDRLFLQTPDHMSMEENVLAKYGQPGVDMIQTLIHMEK